MDNDNQCSVNIYSVAREMAALYPGIISVQGLAEQLACEWKEHGSGGEQAVSLLRRMALGLCSQATCEAWRSGEAERRERAFEVMRGYLHRILLRARYASLFQRNPHVLDDILSQTLETLFVMLRENAEAGPTNPTAFLGWIHTILKRNVYACLKKRQQDSFLRSEERRVG